MRSLSTERSRMVMVVVVVVVMMMVMVAEVGAESALINQPDWGFWSYLGEDYSLHCDNSHLSLQPNNFIRWELPNGQFVDLTDEKYELKSDQHSQVTNMRLTIRNVQDADSGVYVCHVYSTHTMQNKVGHVLRGLNLGVHLYRQPFDQYEHGVLVGGCTAAAVLVVLSAGCLVYKFRYRTTTSKQAPRRNNSVSGNSQQHVTVAGVSQHERPLGGSDETGTELSAVVAYYDGGVVGDDQRRGELNRSYDVMGDEHATKM